MGAAVIGVCAMGFAAGCSTDLQGNGPELGVTSGISALNTNRSRPVTYYVDAAAPRRGDGSTRRPFATIGEALAAATKADASSVTIHIAAGQYTGSHAIDRRTILLGQSVADTVLSGSLWSGLAFDLSVDNLALRPPPGEIAIRTSSPSRIPDRETGALHAGTTTLTAVSIIDASPYGVTQSGGRLAASGIVIAGTKAGPTGIGAAIAVAGGATSTIENAFLRFNAQGLLVEGAGTMVSSPGGLRIADTGSAATPEEQLVPAAAINVIGGAHFQGQGVRIGRSFTRGLQVIGATARLDDARIEGLFGSDDGAQMMQIAVSVWGPSAVELVAPKIDGPGSVGVIVGEGARATLRKRDDAPDDYAYCTSVALGVCGDDPDRPPEWTACFNDAMTTCLLNEWTELFGGWVRGLTIGAMNGSAENPAGCLTQGIRYVCDISMLLDTLPPPPYPPGAGGTGTVAADGCISVPWR
jgi:hypothetical protein